MKKEVKNLYLNFPFIKYARRKKISLKSLDPIKEFLASKFENSKLVKYYRLEGSPDDYYYDIENIDEFGQKVICLSVWLHCKNWTKRDFKQIIKQAFDFNKRRNRVSLYIQNDLKKIQILKNLGFK